MKIEDKKFTYIVVVDFGLVQSTRKKRCGQKEKIDKNTVIDNTKKLMELSSKAKTSFTEQDKDKNKRKIRQEKEEKRRDSSTRIPERRQFCT